MLGQRPRVPGKTGAEWWDGQGAAPVRMQSLPLHGADGLCKLLGGGGAGENLLLPSHSGFSGSKLIAKSWDTWEGKVRAARCLSSYSPTKSSLPLKPSLPQSWGGFERQSQTLETAYH